MSNESESASGITTVRRAAQYIRMSTDHQQYSTDNQADAIRDYAKKCGYEVVRTYADEGKSGLRIEGRDQLRQLSADVESGHTDFQTILVYDISRWGRFQDADESAYYEYVCKRAGIDVQYCAEQFENDGSTQATIFKSVKRAMAGEYSRELSIKVFQGQCNLIEKGFRQGGTAGYGLRRMLIDQHGEQKGILGRGEHKSLQTDRVILVPGPDDEVAVVRRISEMFIQEEKTERQIAAALNQQQIASEWGRPWTRGMVNQILTSEKYIGHNIYNRVSFKLKKKRVQNPPDMWIRAENAFTPIIKPQLFYTAHGIILERNRRFSDDEMLSRLKTLVDRHQRISGILIDESDDMPSSAAYRNRFGSLVRAYRMIGYSPQRDYEYIEINRQLRRMHPDIVEDTIARIQTIGGEIERDPESDLLLINDEFTASIVLSRCRQTGAGSMRGLVRLDQSLQPDITVVGRRGFQALMADAKRKGCDFRVVVVYDVKRFGRVGNDEAGFYRHTLKTHGIEVRYVSENFNGDRTDDLLRPVKQWQAREESKDLSKVTIRGLLTKSASGVWMGGVPPHGYDLRYETTSGGFLMHVRYMSDGAKQVFDEQWKLLRTLPRGESLAVARSDRCRLVLGEDSRREAVQKIFEMYVQENRGFKAVVDALNRTAVPSPRNRSWSSKYSGKWSLTTVRSILVNPTFMGDMVWNRRTDARFHRIVEGQASEREDVYAGRLEPNDPSNWIVVEDAHPAIVTRRLWGLAKAKREGNEASRLQRGINQRLGKPAGTLEPGGPTRGTGGWTGPRAKYLLSGLMTCAKCGNRYEGYSQYRKQRDEHGKRIKTLNYACGGYIRHGRSVCAIGRISKDPMESIVVDAVLNYFAGYTGKNAKAKIAKALANQVGEEEHRDMIAQSAKFIAGLKQALTDAPLDERQAAIRRCIDDVTIDYEQQNARIAIRKLPAVTGGPTANEVESINVALSVSPSRPA